VKFVRIEKNRNDIVAKRVSYFMGWTPWAAGTPIGARRLYAFTSREIAASSRAKDSYQPQFDGLRALAVLTVMVDHFSADVPNFSLAGLDPSRRDRRAPLFGDERLFHHRFFAAGARTNGC
jgi:hypothetical protein